MSLAHTGAYRTRLSPKANGRSRRFSVTQPLQLERLFLAPSQSLPMASCKVMGQRFSWSARLAKFQHVDIDRLSRGMRVVVSCIPGNAEKIAVVDQFESRRLDLRPDQR